jgi:hypothetical protein
MELPVAHQVIPAGMEGHRPVCCPAFLTEGLLSPRRRSFKHRECQPETGGWGRGGYGGDMAAERCRESF